MTSACRTGTPEESKVPNVRVMRATAVRRTNEPKAGMRNFSTSMMKEPFFVLAKTLNNTTSPAIDATNNWWGSPAGPGADPSDDVCSVGTAPDTGAAAVTTFVRVAPAMR